MIILLKTFFRSKMKFILSLIIFIIINLCIVFVLNYREKINDKIEIIENKTNNREFSMITNDIEIVNELYDNINVESLDYTELNGQYYVRILVKNINSIMEIENYLKNKNIPLSLDNDIYVDELDVYQSTKLLFNIFLIILFIILIITVYIQIKMIISWDTDYMIMLKILGYSEYKLLFLTFLKVFSVIFLACIISIIIISIINIFLIEGLSLIFSLIATGISLAIIIIQQPIFLMKINRITYVPIS